MPRRRPEIGAGRPLQEALGDWAQTHGFESAILNLEGITLAPFDWFRKWEDTRWMKRGEDYESLKNNFQERLLEVLYKHVPAAKGEARALQLQSLAQVA